MAENFLASVNRRKKLCFARWVLLQAYFQKSETGNVAKVVFLFESRINMIQKHNFNSYGHFGILSVVNLRIVQHCTAAK